MKLSIIKVRRRIIAICCYMALILGLMAGCGSYGDGTGGSGDVQSGGKEGETARTIVVEETNGTTIVLDEAKESTNAYKGMHLFSGNDVTVQKISDLTMLLDMDKYLYAEERTHFWLEAAGSQENSQTVIYLDEGAELNRIVTPLESGSVYQVNTPNSTMAVRGTVFRVEVRKGNDGNTYAYLCVFSGSVKVELKNTEGEFSGITETFEAGEAAAIRADEEISEFIVGADGNIASPIDYSTLPTGTLEKIIEYIDDGDEIVVDIEELEKILEERKEEEEHEHDWKTVTVRKADCSHEGLEHTVCAECGEVKGEKTIPVTAHKISAGWTTQEEATCTAKGLQVKTCTVCGKVIDSRKTKALDHKPGDAVTVEATCTEAGSVTVSCVNCGQTLEEQIIEALEHQPGEWVVTTPADYGVEGSQSQYCTVCGELLDTQSIPAKTIDYVPPAAPSCKHEWGGWTVTKEATCTETGTQSKTCTLCGATETGTLAALGHTFKEWTVTQQPTCTAKGNRTGTCTTCGTQENESIPMIDHTAGNWTTTKEATCTEAGVETLKCTRCDAAINSRSIGALGHAFEVWTENHVTKAATCTEDGSRARKCTKCNSTETETIPALGHSMTKTEAKEATCTEAGNNAYWTCSICGRVYKDDKGTAETTVGAETITALGHNYVWVVTTEPTCTATGWEKEICDRCGDTRNGKYIPATGHTPGEWKWEEESGAWIMRCTICGEKLGINTTNPSEETSNQTPDTEPGTEETT